MKKTTEGPTQTDNGFIFKRLDDSTSEQLVAMFNNGDARAFHILVVENANSLRDFVSQWLPVKEDGEEVVQELLIYLWEKRESLKYDHVNQLYKYILTAAKNQALFMLRSMKRQSKYNDAYSSGSDQVTETLDESVSFAKLEDTYGQAVHKMPKLRYRAFDMKYNKDMSYEMIAMELDISEATARSHVRNAVNDIKRAFGIVKK